MKKFNEFVNEKKVPKYADRGDCVFPAGSKKVKDKKDHFPINSENQARNALSRTGEYSSTPSWYDGSLEELKASIRSHVKNKYKSIKVSENMTNESNMSYCRFENTYNDLKDCYDNMEDDLSKEESEYRESLISLCKDIYHEFGHLLPTM